MKHKQLTFAREYRGLSQSALAKSITGLSQSNLSKYEKGFGVLTDELFYTIVDYLAFPHEFFEKNMNTTFENAHYRKKATITKEKVMDFEMKCHLIGLIVDEFSMNIQWPEFKFVPLDVEDGFLPEKVASHNRKVLGLNTFEPVKNIYGLLEANGILIYQIDAGDKFDGLSFYSKSGTPIIAVNKNMPNDRQRFTLAHELGHILLHNEENYPVASYRNKEDEANRFASEFLMPETEIKNSLRNIKMSNLVPLKRYWLTSMASILKRAQTLGLMDQNRYTYFMIEMSRCGYKKNEPVQVFIDKAVCLENALKYLSDELHYTKEEMARYLLISVDILNELFFKEKTQTFNVVRGSDIKYESKVRVI